MTSGVKVTRYNNLLRLLNERAGGNKSEFGRLVNLGPAHVSALTTKLRNMGDIAARRVEKALGLSAGWMDIEHGGATPEEDEMLRRQRLMAEAFGTRQTDHKNPGDPLYQVVKAAADDALDTVLFKIEEKLGWDDPVLQRERLSSAFGAVVLDLFAPGENLGVISAAMPTLHKMYFGRVVDTLLAKATKARDARPGIKLYLVMTLPSTGEGIAEAMNYRPLEMLVSKGIFDAVQCFFAHDGQLVSPPAGLVERIPGLLRPLPV